MKEVARGREEQQEKHSASLQKENCTIASAKKKVWIQVGARPANDASPTPISAARTSLARGVMCFMVLQ